MVTDSEKATVKVGVSEGIYVLLAGAVTVEIVGAVRSIITVLAELTEGGPVDVPVTELALSCRIKVPSVQLVTVTV